MAALPPAYAWLDAIGPRPRMIDEALRLLGTAEAPGAANSATILGWARELGPAIERDYRADAVPWCGLFMALVATRAGKAPPDKPLWAANWSRFGTAADAPMLGDVLVFHRPGGGHVGLYVAEDEGSFRVLGGNQGDRVCIAAIARDRLVAARRPLYRSRPASVRAYRASGTPALSRNER